MTKLTNTAAYTFDELVELDSTKFFFNNVQTSAYISFDVIQGVFSAYEDSETFEYTEFGSFEEAVNHLVDSFEETLYVYEINHDEFGATYALDNGSIVFDSGSKEFSTEFFGEGIDDYQYFGPFATFMEAEQALISQLNKGTK